MLSRRILSQCSRMTTHRRTYIPGGAAKKKVDSKKPAIPEKDAKNPLGQPQYCLALTTWVIQPDLGITEFTPLIRSSAFVVKANAKNPEDQQYHVVTSNHNVAPWLFPKYYPEPFMPMINQDHTHYTLELRSATTGEVYTSVDLYPRVLYHPDRDIAVLHMEHEDQSMIFLKQMNFNFLETEEYLPEDNEELDFHGHEVFETSEGDPFDGIDESKPSMTLSLPRTVKGSLAGRTPHQTFCQTEKVLTPGMCGGVAVSRRGSICGMIEGIVPKEHPQEILRNLGVIIDAKDILSFLGHVDHLMQNNLKYSDQVSVLFGGKGLKTLHEYTANKKSIETDPLKSLHNTLYPEEINDPRPFSPKNPDLYGWDKKE